MQTNILAVSVPTIHLNGTSGETLAEENRLDREAIQAAIDSMQSHPPHSRDYYVASNGTVAFEIATAQYRARVVALRAVLRELETIGEALQTVLDERAIWKSRI